ncbi:MAG: hypothetical protein WCI93_00865 [bacterium]
MNIVEMKGFEAINSFTLKKKIELASVSGAKILIENIPVLVSFGAKFDEIFFERKTDSFCFNPKGITSPGEVIFISKEELEHFLEREMIKLF